MTPEATGLLLEMQGATNEAQAAALAIAAVRRGMSADEAVGIVEQWSAEQERRVQVIAP